MSEVGEIAAWLRVQAEADKAAAEAATPGPWEFEGDDPTDDEVYDVAGCRPVAFTRGGDRQVANGQHIALHDPRTETAQAESVLALLDLHEPLTQGPEGGKSWTECGECGPNNRGSGVISVLDDRDGCWWPCRTVLLLAWGYRFREGYLEEWKP